MVGGPALEGKPRVSSGPGEVPSEDGDPDLRETRRGGPVDCRPPVTVPPRVAGDLVIRLPDGQEPSAVVVDETGRVGPIDTDKAMRARGRARARQRRADVDTARLRQPVVRPPGPGPWGSITRSSHRRGSRVAPHAFRRRCETDGPPLPGAAARGQEKAVLRNGLVRRSRREPCRYLKVG